MSNSLLITGGAGFIGQKLIAKLLSVNPSFDITVLDNFSEQVHDQLTSAAPILSKVRTIRADIRDREVLKKLLQNASTLVHLAAETGTGQSMYKVSHYFDVNVQATANIVDILKSLPGPGRIKNIVFASSRAVFGEGAYSCPIHGIVYPGYRNKMDLDAGRYEPLCPICSGSIEAISTSEDAPYNPSSYYGLTKQVQEQILLMYAEAAQINCFSLKFQNVYGPGQSLKNPYTGILAVFSNLARQKKVIDIYEDGFETRDFVYIDDVVSAIEKAIFFQGKFTGTLNIGSGVPTSIFDLASFVNGYFKNEGNYTLSGKYRLGDIRHNFANISRAKIVLGYEPKLTFFDGVRNFLSWVENEKVYDSSLYSESVKELSSRGLMGGAN